MANAHIRAVARRAAFPKRRARGRAAAAAARRTVRLPGSARPYSGRGRLRRGATRWAGARGVVWGAGSNQVEEAKLKPLGRLLPLRRCPDVSRRFVDWVAGYTVHPPGAVLRMVMSVPKHWLRPSRNGPCAEPTMTPASSRPRRGRVLAVLAHGPHAPSLNSPARRPAARRWYAASSRPARWSRRRCSPNPSRCPTGGGRASPSRPLKPR